MFYESPDFDNENEDGNADDSNGNYTPSFTGVVGKFIAREILKEVHQALVEKGYNPINQLVGYILSGDPTYITNHNNARNLIKTIERDDLLESMVANYLNIGEENDA